MNRRYFLSLATGLLATKQLMTNKNTEPEVLYFKDDGSIPNSKYPLLLYRNAFSKRGDSGAEWLEQHFREHNSL